VVNLIAVHAAYCRTGKFRSRFGTVTLPKFVVISAVPGAVHYSPSMQQSLATKPSKEPANFAGMLAELAAPEKKFPPARDDDGLADDITTLTYEHALRSHSRYQPASDPTDSRGDPYVAATPRVASHDFRGSRETPATADREIALPAPTKLEQTFKRSSITMRLSEAESTQLRTRAADAGMTVSAYLRSCTFEAENLRALVKSTMAQLRSATAAPAVQVTTGLIPAVKLPSHSHWTRFWRRFREILTGHFAGV
jgi:hypothetical protein